MDDQDCVIFSYVEVAKHCETAPPCLSAVAFGAGRQAAIGLGTCNTHARSRRRPAWSGKIMIVYGKGPFLDRFLTNWGEFVLPIFVRRPRILVPRRRISVHGRLFSERFLNG